MLLVIEEVHKSPIREMKRVEESQTVWIDEAKMQGWNMIILFDQHKDSQKGIKASKSLKRIK